MNVADVRLARKLRKAGIVYPVWTVRAARKTGLPVTLACAILDQETGGGKNEWGHDPTIFVGGFDGRHGHAYGETVTKAAYLMYLAQRGVTGAGGMQGVGSCQLTWWAFQDEADRLGGCWKPYPNMLAGFGDLAHLVRRDGLKAGVAAYNGSGKAANAYAISVMKLEREWAVRLGVPSIQTEGAK